MSNEQILRLTVKAVNVLKRSPFIEGQPIRISSVTGGSVYGVNEVSRTDETRKVVAKGDGSKTLWDVADLSCLSNATIVADAGVTIQLELAVIVLVPDVHGDLVTPLTRRGSDIAPGATEFRIVDAGGGVPRLEFGAAPAGEFALLCRAASEVAELTGGALGANRPYEVTSYDFLGTAVADVDIERLLR